MAVKAGQSEIIQANQKDDEYKSFFQNSLGEFFRDLTGTQSWIKRKEELELFADIIYFSVTTLSGYQTLGEEYCSLVQVDTTRQNIPTKWQRGVMVLTQVVIPYITKRCLRHFEQTLQCASASDNESKMKNVVLVLIPLFKQLINVVQRLHLMTFYFSSVYFDVGKRLAGIQYLLVHGVVRNEYYNPTYRVLGWVTFLHLSVSIVQLIQQSLQIFPKIKAIINNIGEEEANIRLAPKHSVITEFKCTLCLEKLHDITTTPCGHLFCWYCINEWCRTKTECPLCREDFQAQQLVYLHHFYPT